MKDEARRWCLEAQGQSPLGAGDSGDHAAGSTERRSHCQRCEDNTLTLGQQGGGVGVCLPSSPFLLPPLWLPLASCSLEPLAKEPGRWNFQGSGPGRTGKGSEHLQEKDRFTLDNPR